jgi:hypothetical protein
VRPFGHDGRVTYAVTVDVSVAEGAPELDALQSNGALFLLRKGLDAVESVEGPDGVEVEFTDSFVGVHPGGAVLKVFVEAPALEVAEDAVGEVVGEVLEQTGLLADWVITKCEVELHPDLVKESLEAADGPDAPPADPAERARRHAEGKSDGTVGRLDDGEAEAMRGRLRSLAPRLKGFPLECFGYSGDGEDRVVGREAAEVAAGALVDGIGILVDELFADLAGLEEEGTSVAESDEVFMVLDDLPRRFALRYDVLFVRRLTVTAVMMTGRLTQPRFGRLSCVAEELLMRLLLSRAEVTADTYGLLSGEVGTALDAFAGGVYEGLDHEWLYAPAADGTDEDPAPAHPGIAPMGLQGWFSPFDESRYVHPYAANEDDLSLEEERD